MLTKDKYDVLKQKYPLPEFALLNQYFNIEDVESSDEMILQNIRKILTEKLLEYSALLQNSIQPGNDLSDLYEARYLTEENKQDVYNLFKRLMLQIRKSNLIGISNTEQNNAEFIISTCTFWDEIRPDIEKHIKRITHMWDMETDIKEDLSYFG